VERDEPRLAEVVVARVLGAVAEVRAVGADRGGHEPGTAEAVRGLARELDAPPNSRRFGQPPGEVSKLAW
jgi:hypothetical protein